MRTIEAKIYLKPSQEKTLLSWMRVCCGIYNRALEQRIKAYCRRGESVTYLRQQTLLTTQRERIPHLTAVPLGFERDALRRVDRGMQAFFRRVKTGKKPGFPRFRPVSRYTSMEYSTLGQYIRGDGLLSIPKLGLVKYRAGKQRISKTQRLLRIIHRAAGWFAQVVVDEVKPVAPLTDEGPIGIDMGLSTFAALSTGEKIDNPRFARKSERKLRSLQRRVSRRKKGSNRRKKAVRVLRRHHERIAAQRRAFCHQVSTDLVRRHWLIAVEKLNIKGLSRTRLARSFSDAGWSIFLNQLRAKAECAGRELIEVDPRFTSQTCPECGTIQKKELWERKHECPCGCVGDRDVIAARVILLRAVGGNRGTQSGVEGMASIESLIAARQADPGNRLENLILR